MPPLPFAAPWFSFNSALTSKGGSPVALATGDFDGDGDLDVVAPRLNAQGGFVFLRNNGAGRLAAFVSYPGAGSSAGIVAADLDGDGRLDVAVTDSDALTVGNTVSVFLGDGTGSFGPRQAFSVGSGAVVPVGIAAADSMGMATRIWRWRLLVITGADRAWLLRDNGDRSFAAPVSFRAGPSPSDLASGDLTRSGGS